MRAESLSQGTVHAPIDTTAQAPSEGWIAPLALMIYFTSVSRAGAPGWY